MISACAAGGEWRRGAALFDEMRNRWGIKPDVVSCTALVTAFGTDGQWARAQQVTPPKLMHLTQLNSRSQLHLFTCSPVRTTVYSTALVCVWVICIAASAWSLHRAVCRNPSADSV